MRKVAGLLAFVLIAMLVGCSAPADVPANKWVAFLDKHRALINEGKFNVDEFKKEGQPIADELAKAVDPKEKKLLMTEPVLNEWNRASKEFSETAADKNADALFAYLEISKVWADAAGVGGDNTPPSNG
jgi:hypothetical protein